MIKKKIVSTILTEVRANASFSTRKPSTVTMEIDRRFSLEAYQRYLDQQENIDPELGLVGFELVALYEDGEAEPMPEDVADMIISINGDGPPLSENADSEDVEADTDAKELPFEDENSDVIEDGE